MQKINQEKRIKEYMQLHGGITTLEAYNSLGITRLAARISDLKRHGERIEREKIKVMNRHGEITHVTRYSLEEVEA